MVNKITCFLVITLFVLGCEKKEELILNDTSFTENNLSQCKTLPCPQITINYVEVYGDKQVADSINYRLQYFIKASLVLSEDPIPTAKTIDEAALGFVNAYLADKEQFPDMAGDYFSEIRVSNIYNSENLLCFETRQYQFTGGAHGYGSTSFLNFNPVNGALLTNKELFTDISKFSAFAEEKFRAAKKIPFEKPINSTGFWFQNEKFSLPETVGFINDTLIFVYNPYDIASYSEGAIEFKISKKDAAPFLKVK